MNSSHSTNIDAAAPGDSPLSFFKWVISGWNRFWFTPADPTLWGMIRIGCGLLALYTIIAYSFDLQEFFGKDAWLNLELRMKYVRESPYMASPLNWPMEETSRPQGPDENAYVDAYKKKWGQLPPLPFPKNKAEEDYFDDYRKYWGIDPRQTLAVGSPAWSIWFHVTDPKTMWYVHLSFIAITFLFVIGFGTRVTSVLAWCIALSYIHRSPVTLFGVDTMMIITLMYLMVAPCGAALSVDVLIARWWRARRGQPALAPTVPLVSANFALRLLQIHVCFIYASAGLAKLKGNSWWEGEAIWGTLANYAFAPMSSPAYMWFLETLVSNQFVLQMFLIFGTYFTLFFEITYPFLIWNRRTRWLILFMALVLHGLIGMLMGLRTFAFMMLVMNMAFLPLPIILWLKTKFNALDRLIWQRGTPAPAEKETVAAEALVAQDHLPEMHGRKLKRLHGDRLKRKK